MPNIPVTPEKKKEIYRLRQVERKTSPQIQKMLGVGSTSVAKYGGPAIPDVQFRKGISGTPIKEVDKFLRKHGKPTTGTEEKRRIMRSKILNELKNSEKNKLSRERSRKTPKAKKTAAIRSQRPEVKKKRSQAKKLKTEERRKEREILKNKNPVIVTDEEQIRKLAKEKANNSLHFHKKRSTLYKIKRANDNSSWVTWSKLEELKNKGVNPNIYKKSIAGDFSKEGAKAMRAKVERQTREFLESGGDARYIPNFGHQIALNAVDESGQRIASGLTTAGNTGLQDADINNTLGAEVDKRMLDGKPSRQLLKSRGFLPGLAGMATLPFWLLAPDLAQAMVDKGEETISSTADKYLPQGLIDYAKNIGSKVNNYIGQAFDKTGANNPRTIPGVHASIGQMLYEGAKQTPGEIAGLGMALKDIHNKSLKAPEENLSWLEEMRRLQSGRSY
jgi:hypothetical protein